MTEQHPLTDEMCQDIYDLTYKADEMMRTAYDLGENKGRADMLEQVEKSVERRIKVLRQSGYVFAADAIEDFFQGIIQNMRPQQQQENN